MPPRYEPCGLGQLIALRYGGGPIVRRTGGLADTGTEFDPARRTGTGFLFDPFTPHPLLAAGRRGAPPSPQPTAWEALGEKPMARGLLWGPSAPEYAPLF